MVKFIDTKAEDSVEVIAKKKLLMELMVEPQVQAYMDRYSTTPHSLVLVSSNVAILFNPEDANHVITETDLIEFDKLELKDNDGDLVLVFDDEEFKIGYLSNTKASKLKLDDLFENNDYVIIQEDIGKIYKSLSTINAELDKFFE